jgi:hypothetical protein
MLLLPGLEETRQSRNALARRGGQFLVDPVSEQTALEE